MAIPIKYLNKSSIDGLSDPVFKMPFKYQKVRQHGEVLEAHPVEQSISRAMVNLIDEPHLNQIRKFKVLFARYQRSRDLIAVGAYVAGSDPVLDQAVALYPKMEQFLQQPLSERADFASSRDALFSLI